jgi:hypothetical protein
MSSKNQTWNDDLNRRVFSDEFSIVSFLSMKNHVTSGGGLALILQTRRLVSPKSTPTSRFEQVICGISEIARCTLQVNCHRITNLIMDFRFQLR